MKYQIIYADPPWKYNDNLGSDNASMGSCEYHYPTMTIDEISSLPIRELADENCILFMWATFPKLNEVFKVIEAWGFEYKTVAFTWVKLNPKSKTVFKGIGRWVQGNAEIVLLATKGHPKRISKSVSQVVLAERGAHSVKPEAVREKIVELMGDIPRVELFAREHSPMFKKPDGWDVWGNEVNSDIEILTH